jgi:hypothetical protein
MEVEAAHGNLPCQLIKREGRVACFNNATGLFNTRNPLKLGGQFVWLTAFTGPKTSVLRRFWRIVEGGIFTQRAACAAGWPAKYTGRFDGKDKRPVGESITLFNRLPALLLRDKPVWLFHGCDLMLILTIPSWQPRPDEKLGFLLFNFFRRSGRF